MTRKGPHVLSWTGRAGEASPTYLPKGVSSEFGTYVHLTKEADAEGVTHVVQ